MGRLGMLRDKTKHFHEDFLEKDAFKIINCQSCGFWHVYPIPDREVLNKYYQNLYYQSGREHGDMMDKKEDPDGYYRIKYGDKLKNLERLLPANAEKAILDLGAGYGDFLEFMQANGWVTEGIETSAYCLENRKRLDCNIVQANLEDIGQLKLDRYAVITLNTVLEHYPYPENLLLLIKDKLMNSDTILHIEVPNDFSLLQEMVTIVCDTGKYWLHPPGHLNYWNHETLSRFVTRLGFKIEIIESTFPLEIMAILGDDYITHSEKGRGVHMRRVKLEKKLNNSKNIDLKMKLYHAFAAVGIGREILLYLKKT